MRFEGSLAVALVMVACSALAEEYTVSTVADLQEKVRESVSGDVIKVAPGTYKLTETLKLTNTVTLTSTGSRADTFFEPADGFNERLVFLQAPTTTAASRPIFSGVTCRGTCTTNMSGGLIYVSYPGGTIQDCRFTGAKIYSSTYSTDVGGAVFMHPGGTLRRSIVDHNASFQVTANNGKVKPTAGVLMTENSGLKSNIGGCVIENCLIVQNDGLAVNYGFITYYNPTIRNCTIVDNTGYAALSAGRESEFYNNIFLVTSNRSMYRNQATYPAGRNTTHYKNNFQINNPVTSTASNVSHENNVLGWDAMFVNPGAMDYHLKPGSPCINAGRAYDGAGTVDLDGNPRTTGEATDIGCYEYDPSYVGKNPVLYVSYATGDDANAGTSRAAPLKTVAHAYDIAEDGTTVTLLAGRHPLSATLTLAKPIKVVGESGRDKTFLELADGATPVTLVHTKHILAEVHDITICKNSKTMVQQTLGGLIEGCRITGFTNTTANVSPVAWYGEWGTLYRTVIDKNFLKWNNASAVFVMISGRVDDSSHHTRGGIVDTCLVAENACWFDGSKKHVLSGGLASLTRNGTCTGSPSQLINSTILSNDMAGCVGASRFAGSIRNNIILHRGSEQALTLSELEKYKYGSICVSNCTPVIATGGTGVTELPVLRTSGPRIYTPKADASVIGMAQPYAFAKDDLDLNGNPRLRKDGAQDIGCLQYMPSGLILMLR